MAAVPRRHLRAGRRTAAGTGGQEPLALDAFLERHPEIEEIEICTNNDFAGRWAAAHIERAYQGRYRMVKNLPRREGCDYGDLAKENYERRAARSLSDGSR